MKITEIKPRIFQVDFETREDLLKTFIRFQEYYESPEFKGKVFTVEEYAAWYMKETGKDTFTYFSDWSGCNVPKFVFDDFMAGKFPTLRDEEKALLSLLPKDGKDYYVIGTFQGGRKDVIEHEICHGMYYSNKEYKNEVDEVLNSRNDLKPVQDHILKKGYHPAVLQDETHAYICASTEHLEEKGVAYPKEVSAKLKELVKKYS